MHLLRIMHLFLFRRQPSDRKCSAREFGCPQSAVESPGVHPFDEFTATLKNGRLYPEPLPELAVPEPVEGSAKGSE